jgi:hypothetical protein
MASTVDVKAFIDERPISAFQCFLVAMRFVVVAADGMDVAIMGFVTPSILQEWDVSRPAFGIVISAAPFGLVIGALVAGPWSDRLGRKMVLIVSVFLFGIFTAATAYASSPTDMALLRLLAGIGMGAAMPNTTTLLSQYAPQRRRSLMIHNYVHRVQPRFGCHRLCGPLSDSVAWVALCLAAPSRGVGLRRNPGDAGDSSGLRTDRDRIDSVRKCRCDDESVRSH